MAGHSHAANIKHRKSAKDIKKGSNFAKLAKRIASTARFNPDPNSNPSLRVAISEAKRACVPKNTIENAINSSLNKDTNALESIRYNISMGTALFVIETLTDNRNRSASSIRLTAAKLNCNLTETGAVEFAFDHLGAIVYLADICAEDDILLLATELDCVDFEHKSGFYILYVNKKNLHSVYEKVSQKYSDSVFIDLIWKPKNIIEVDQETKEKVEKLICTLKNIPDVQDVFVNIERDVEF
ncbi:MAG: YebC/PmpR family DNA-binding transcriptional regulator [Alphaproteobacteria bacterium]|nr:YebC/PmpR family DNA-binding transcriptional regulator [Rickettsiales bacterium]